MGSYVKVVSSGHIIEIYEYAFPPKPKIQREKDDFNPFNYDDTELHIKVDRVNERRLQTTRDARNTAKRIALNNFGENDAFVTLTFAENMQDLNKADDEFKKFIKRFKYHYELDDLKYIAVRELQQRGAIHYHMLMDFKKPSWVENKQQLQQLERDFADVWKNGFVDIEFMNHVDNVGAYIIKYMTKNISIELYKGKKMYLCSRGNLERPKIYRGIEAEKIIELYQLKDKKEVFTNSYESEYQGLTIYKEYNLKRN